MRKTTQKPRRKHERIPIYKIRKTLNPEFMKVVFSKNLKKIAPEIKKIKSLEIIKKKELTDKDYLEFTAKYKLSGKTADNKVIEKNFYGNIDNIKGRGKKYFALLKQLQKRGFSRPPMVTARPLIYLADFNLLMTEEVSGDNLATYIKKNKKNLKKIFSQVSKFLATIQRKEIKRVELLTLKKEKQLFLDYAVSSAKEKYPEKSQEIIKLAKETFSLEEKFYNKKYFTFVHGDFHPSNIIVSKDKIGILDFNLSCKFDPARDVGSFMSQFQHGWFQYNRQKVLPMKEKEILANYFLKEYLKYAKYTPDLEKRIIIQRCQVILQIITHIIKQKRRNKRTVNLLIKKATNLISKIK